MKITFEDKVSTITSPLPEINRITAANINEIKQVVNYNADAGFPIGSGCDYFGTTAPENFMFADGSAISRTTYAALFAIIGTTYGTGDGSTTFNLPDKRERVSVMYKSDSTMGTTGATFDTLGAKGGEDTHQLITAELPAHTHTMTAKEGYGDGSTTYVSSVTPSTATRTTTISPSSVGGDTAHNNLQPYFVCNYIIRVK